MEHTWIGIIAVSSIVAFLIWIIFKDRLKCPQCGSRNIRTTYNGFYDYKCNKCGREFSKEY